MNDISIISTLFAWDCDEALQKIFLHLDPYSLKSSRQVRVYSLDTAGLLVRLCDNRSANNGATLSRTGSGEVHQEESEFSKG